MAKPQWWIEGPHVIETWQQGDWVYAIQHHPDASYPWCLDYAYHNGGGGSPFKTREELEEYMRRNGIGRPAQQMTLGI